MRGTAKAEATSSRELATDELVEIVWTEVRRGKASSVSEAVRRLLPGLNPSDEARDELLAVGLISLAHGAQHGARRRGRYPVGFGRPSGAQLVPYLRILATPYEDAAGRERALLDFTVADLDALAARCRMLEEAWLRRAKALETLRRQMARYSVPAVRDLPAEALERAAREFDAAFGGAG